MSHVTNNTTMRMLMIIAYLCLILFSGQILMYICVYKHTGSVDYTQNGLSNLKQ